jgi:hypothetical protein
LYLRVDQIWLFSKSEMEVESAVPPAPEVPEGNGADSGSESGRTSASGRKIKAVTFADGTSSAAAGNGHGNISKMTKTFRGYFLLFGVTPLHK